jgi:hypothetical protein
MMCGGGCSGQREWRKRRTAGGGGREEEENIVWRQSKCTTVEGGGGGTNGLGRSWRALGAESLTNWSHMSAPTLSDVTVSPNLTLRFEPRKIVCR